MNKIKRIIKRSTTIAVLAISLSLTGGYLIAGFSPCDNCGCKVNACLTCCQKNYPNNHGCDDSCIQNCN